MCMYMGSPKFAVRGNVSIMSGVAGTLPKTRMTDEEEEHVLNLRREPSIGAIFDKWKDSETLGISLYNFKCYF